MVYRFLSFKNHHRKLISKSQNNAQIIFSQMRFILSLLHIPKTTTSFHIENITSISTYIIFLSASSLKPVKV